MFEVTYFTGKHQGGTKEYHLYLFRARSTGNALLVKRWGRVGADGQIKVERLSRSDDGFNKALKERATKGYDMRQAQIGFPDGVVGTVKEALTLLPIAHRRSFYQSDLAHLDPVTYDASVRATYDPMADERDKLRRQIELQAEQERAAERAAEAAAEAEQMKSNPFYGMF